MSFSALHSNTCGNRPTN